MQFVIRTLAGCVLMVWVIGCGPANLRQAKNYLEKGQYPQAVGALTRARNDHPDNPRIRRDLGIAYYKMERYEQALAELQDAKQQLRKDSHVIFYLGLIYEQLEQYDKAIEEYSHYTQLSRFSPKRREIQHRIQWLTRQEAVRWAKAQLEMEAQIDSTTFPEDTVAVTYFAPRNVPEDLEPLHKGLTDLLISDLKLVDDLRVLERLRLQEIYDELGLNSTDLVTQDTAPRMGKLLGAYYLISGAFTGLANESWRVDPTVGQISLNTIQALEGVEGQLARFLQVEKELAMQILERLGIVLSPEEKEAIEENVPTLSLRAFLAYSKGLDYEDGGMYTEAADEFENAISLDPKFDQAKKHLRETQFLSTATISRPDELELEWQSAVLEEDVTNEALVTTVASVSQTVPNASQAMESGFTRSVSRGNDSKIPEESVKIKVTIRQ